MLELRGVEAGYAASRVLFSVDLEVGHGQTVCLLGRNGVGKTTLLRTIIGYLHARAGTVMFAGHDITHARTYHIARLGLAYVPADRRCFPALTVDENLEVAERRAAPRRRPWTKGRVFELFPALADLRSLKAAYLSGGQQQMLTIGRALIGNPQMLLLDEPAEGLAPVILESLAEQIRTLAEEGLTILMAEMNTGFAMSTCERAYVMEKGEIRYSGTTAELKDRDDLMVEYLAV